jgi:hypothetical protein
MTQGSLQFLNDAIWRCGLVLLNLQCPECSQCILDLVYETFYLFLIRQVSGQLPGQQESVRNKLRGGVRGG